MDVRLRPLGESELAEWLASSRAGYADDMVRHGGLSREGAERKAEDDFANLFPEGLSTSGDALYVIEARGEVAGSVFFAERKRDGRRVAWLYEIRVDEEKRGQGLGRRAMELLETEVRRRGLDRLELNVFGGNEVARSLYLSLGFTETAVTMGKDL
jgi:ribosomal protein S18 acetylase RimI-like enzyme